MGFVGLGLELGVELAGDVEFVRRQFDDFDQTFFRADGADDEAFGFELFAVVGVELEAMAMTLGDAIGIVVELCGLCAGKKDGLAGTKAHVVAHGGEFFLFFLQADNGMRGVFVELGGVGIGKAADVPCELDAGDLHTEADAEIGNVFFASILGGIDFALDAAISKSTGDEDAIDVADDLGCNLIFHRFGVDLDDLDFGIVRGSRMDQRLVDGFVGVLELGVFSCYGDGDTVLGMQDALDEFFPVFQGGRWGVAESDFVHYEAVDFIATKVERALVNGVIAIAEGDDIFLIDVAEHRDLAAVVFIEVVLGAADDDVGLDANFAEFGDGLLSRLGFDLAGGFEERKQCDVDEADIFFADFERKLAECFEKKETFHVADGAANFRDQHVDIGVVVGDLVDARFDFIGNVRDELHGLAEVVATAFFFDDGVKNLTRGEIVHA